jgi:hypothetical protein
MIELDPKALEAAARAICPMPMSGKREDQQWELYIDDARAAISAYLAERETQGWPEEMKHMPRMSAVRVQATDYSYEGRMVTAFAKIPKEWHRVSVIRCVVEDDRGRLFIHNPAQLSLLA